jgi:hypothetical protein
LHSSILFIHFLCTLSTLKLLPIFLDTLVMTISPLWKGLPECMCKENMLPFNFVCTFLILLRSVSTGGQVWFLTFVGTTTVESDRIIFI